MKKFVQWVRTHAAIIIATSALVGVAAPGAGDLVGAVTAVTKAVVAAPAEGE